MDIFCERFKGLRIERNMSQAELAKALSVSQTGVSGWERGYRQPDFDTLRLIAKYFDVSSDYLLGLNDWK